MLITVLVSNSILVVIAFLIWVLVTKKHSEKEKERFSTISPLTDNDIDSLKNKCSRLFNSAECNNRANEYKSLRDSYNNGSIDDNDREELDRQTNQAKRYL